MIIVKGNSVDIDDMMILDDFSKVCPILNYLDLFFNLLT